MSSYTPVGFVMSVSQMLDGLQALAIPPMHALVAQYDVDVLYMLYPSKICGNFFSFSCHDLDLMSILGALQRLTCRKLKLIFTMPSIFNEAKLDPSRTRVSSAIKEKEIHKTSPCS